MEANATFREAQQNCGVVTQDVSGAVGNEDALMFMSVFLHPSTPNGNPNKVAHCDTIQITGKTNAAPEGSFSALLQWAAAGPHCDNADDSAPLPVGTDAYVFACLPHLENFRVSEPPVMPGYDARRAETLPLDAAVRDGERGVPLLTLDDLCKLQTLPLRVAASRAQLSETQFKQVCKRLTGNNDWPYRQLNCLDRHISRWVAQLAQSARYNGGTTERSVLERAIALARHTKEMQLAARLIYKVPFCDELKRIIQKSNKLAAKTAASAQLRRDDSEAFTTALQLLRPGRWTIFNGCCRTESATASMGRGE